MYKAIKKFYDPFSQKRVAVGDTVEVPEQYLDAYLPYVRDIEIPVPEKIEAKAPTIEEAKASPAMQVTERKPAKKKVK